MEQSIWFVAGAGLIALGSLLGSMAFRKKQRLLSDMPTSKVQGVFIGMVELKGTAESEAPLTSYLAGTSAVHYRYDVQEKWSRTVVETYTDKDGKSHTRTRVESGWTSVVNGGETQDFYLKDDTGALLIRPKGAKLETVSVFEKTVTRSDPLYYAKGPESSVPNSNHVRRFTEQALPLHASLYVVGRAKERADVVAPEIAEDKEADVFLISTDSEEKVQRGYGLGSWLFWVLGLVGAGAAGALLGAGSSEPPIPQILAAVAVYFALWAVAWIWMVYNSLVGLRQRVRQGWSQIDVQLKRRADLIPNLAGIVSGFNVHERQVQETIASLRAQSQATAPGVSGPDFDGVAGSLRAVIERYPELKAQEGFLRLHDELVTTEQRIALARTYYNDIATHYATRLERIPDAWVARLGAMKPEPLLSAANFERAAVQVNFA